MILSLYNIIGALKGSIPQINENYRYRGSKSRIPSSSALNRYKHHIQEIHFGGAYRKEILQLKQCNNLHTIRISTINSYNQPSILGALTPLIRAHSSTLQKILVTPLFYELSIPPDEFFEAISQCSNLKILSLRSLQQLPLVLRACSIPHTLGLQFVHFDYDQEEGFGFEFLTIQDISALYSGSFSSVGGQRGAAELTRCCHNLKSLTLGIPKCIGPLPEYSLYFNSKWNCDDYLKTLLQDPLALPHLESLDISCTTAEDKLYGELLKQLDQIKSLNARYSDIGLKWFQALIARIVALLKAIWSKRFLRHAQD
ncbi:hypothetical protein BGZ76_006405 [Entomortierella beljakovae]|nr:hypothetical protein BGZ76_006405 [Entomortierella beljakovae]